MAKLPSFYRHLMELRQRRKDLLQSGLFDAEWYIQNYDDVGGARDPMKHFLTVGSREDRSPGPAFDTRKYLARYKDVAKSGMEPWRHYHIHGRSEHRLAGPHDNMLESYDDVRGTLDVIRKNLSDLENRFQLLFTDELPLARLANLERISAQWQASIPRLLDRQKSDSVLILEDKVRDLQQTVDNLQIPKKQTRS